MIRIENLSKTYEKGSHYVEALSNINITVNKGEIFGIIGLSGAGKSSLIRCINRIEKPSKGSIWVNDINITALNENELRKVRKKMGMIFQNFNLLYSKTVFENIAFPLRLAKLPEEAIQKRVHELLEIVDLREKSNVFPRQLSGGQKQRVGIARALATEPDILLCDEATSALDPKTTKQILSLLKDINQTLGLTIVLITHEMEVVKEICHRVAILEDGKVVEMDETIKIFTKPSTEANKHFIEQTIAIPEHFSEGKILYLNFSEDSAEKPIIAELIRKFDIEVNILSGSIEYVQGRAIGRLMIGVPEDDCHLQDIITYFEANRVRVEVLENGKLVKTS